MVKGFIHYKDARIPFVIQDYRMDLFTDDSILNAFIGFNDEEIKPFCSY